MPGAVAHLAGGAGGAVGEGPRHGAVPDHHDNNDNDDNDNDDNDNDDDVMMIMMCYRSMEMTIRFHTEALLAK